MAVRLADRPQALQTQALDTEWQTGDLPSKVKTYARDILLRYTDDAGSSGTRAGSGHLPPEAAAKEIEAYFAEGCLPPLGPNQRPDLGPLPHHTSATT